MDMGVAPGPRKTRHPVVFILLLPCRSDTDSAATRDALKKTGMKYPFRLPGIAAARYWAHPRPLTSGGASRMQARDRG